MKIFKGQKTKPQNKIYTFYLLRYLGAAILLLFIPFLPINIPEFHSNPILQSRYCLLADVLLLWSVGAMFERNLFQAIIQDAKEKKEGGYALNASSLLFFANPVLLLFTCAAIIHLYSMWYACPTHPMPSVETKQQCIAVMLGVFFCLYGRFLPVCKYGSRWGICTKHTVASEERWKQLHKSCSKIMMIGGFLLLIPALFLSGITALSVTLVGTLAILMICYGIK